MPVNVISILSVLLGLNLFIYSLLT